MTFEVTYDGIRGNHITYNEKWNIVASDKSMVESIFRMKAAKARVYVNKIHSIEELKE